MGRGKRKWLSGGSGTDTSPKQEAKRGNSDEEFSSLTMADSGEHDEGNPSLSDVWKALMWIDNNTNSLIRDLKVLQLDYEELREFPDFSQAKEKNANCGFGEKTARS